MAAMHMALKKVWAQRSYRVAMRLQSLSLAKSPPRGHTYSYPRQSTTNKRPPIHYPLTPGEISELVSPPAVMEHLIPIFHEVSVDSRTPFYPVRSSVMRVIAVCGTSSRTALPGSGQFLVNVGHDG